MRARVCGTLLALCSALWAGAAPAQTANERVAAESLFLEGRRLLQAGQYVAACEKFKASRSLEPALGTSLNLAACYEGMGRTASAWAEFKSVAAEARKAGDAMRQATASERAAALEPRLSRLRISAAEPGVAIWRNGEPVSAATLASAIPVDPGQHRIEARAPGKRPWTKSIDVSAEGSLLEVQIPLLADAAAVNAARGSTGRTWPWVSGAVGVAGVSSAVLLGLLASSEWSEAKASCADYPYSCTAKGRRGGERARTLANVATGAAIFGGVGLGLSAVLFVIEPGGAAELQLALGPSSLTARGSF